MQANTSYMQKVAALTNGLIPSLDNFNTTVMQRAKIGSFKHVEDFSFRDKVRILSGAALPLTERMLFNVPIGQARTPWNGGTSFTTQKRDTNMRTAGQLPQGYEFWCRSIQARFHVFGGEPAAGSISNGVIITPTSAAAVDAFLTAHVLRETILLTNFVGGLDYEPQHLNKYPSDYPLVGAAGAGAAANYVAVVNNGLKSEDLSVPIIVEGGENFGGKIEATDAVVPQATVEIEFIWKGILLSKVR